MALMNLGGPARGRQKKKKKRRGALERQSIFASTIYMFFVLKKEITRKKARRRRRFFFSMFRKNCLVHAFSMGMVCFRDRREKNLGLSLADLLFLVD